MEDNVALPHFHVDPHFSEFGAKLTPREPSQTGVGLRWGKQCGDFLS